MKKIVAYFQYQKNNQLFNLNKVKAQNFPKYQQKYSLYKDIKNCNLLIQVKYNIRTKFKKKPSNSKSTPSIVVYHRNYAHNLCAFISSG